MAKSAVTELTAHIESIRQEAYNEGYAEAMRAVVEFSTSGTAKPTTTTAKRPSAKAISTKSTITPTAEPRRQGRVRATPAVRRTTSRGDNARHIAEALSALPKVPDQPQQSARCSPPRASTCPTRQSGML
jgi:hypothetical protein